MKQPGKLTPELRGQIRVFSASGMKQKDVAMQLGVSVHLVRKAQAECHLRPNSSAPCPEDMEKKIRALIKAGWGEPAILARLNVPRRWIRKLIAKYKDERAKTSSGIRYHLSDEQLTRLRHALTEGERRIAAEFGIPHHAVRAFRRRMWNSAGEQNWRRRRA
jgi:transposase